MNRNAKARVQTRSNEWVYSFIQEFQFSIQIMPRNAWTIHRIFALPSANNLGLRWRDAGMNALEPVRGEYLGCARAASRVDAQHAQESSAASALDNASVFTILKITG